jgi:RNA polymerase sigma-70 factor (ECF subfamily)
LRSWRTVIGKLQGLDDTNDGRLPDVATDLGAALKAHRAEFAEFLGRRTFDFELVTENLEKALEYYKDHNSQKSNELREQVMYDTFLKLSPQFGGAKCYGRWGSAHILRHALDRGETFGMMLNRPGSPVAGKVASILMIYKDTQALQMPGYRVQNADSPVQWITPFAGAAIAPLTLFRLAGIDALGPNLLSKGDGQATDFVQYVVLVKGGKPDHPLGDLAVPTATRFSELPAVVIKSVPESGSTNVSPDLTEIRVTFSKTMGDGWAWCRAAMETPSLSNIHYDNERRIIIATTKLDPGHQYAVWLNLQGCTGFKDMDGQSSVPFLLSFQTAK